MTHKKGVGVIAMIKSALAAAFGVQKRANLERDFTKGKPTHFILVGLVGTLVFILLLVLIVKIVLSTQS